MKQDFLDYIHETFTFSPEEFESFQNALSKPLKKTLRINTRFISVEDFKKYIEQKGWSLSPTNLGDNMFYVDREDTSLPIGHSLQHISGQIYMQELAASSSPYYMSGDKVDTSSYTILDMSASPGGKTTQLCEYYPNSLIVANEIDKSRMRQLHDNTDRLGASNVIVTNYDGRHFSTMPEVFDKILLDAPCSGEGTAYKNDDALKYWNLKNIRRIAKLQGQLIESALVSLKIGGELIYSTCTLNRLENEEIIEKVMLEYGENVEITPLAPSFHGREGARRADGMFVRSWPHTNAAGGFFVAKIQKLGAIEAKKNKELKRSNQGFAKCSNNEDKMIKNYFLERFDIELRGKFYTYRDEIYYCTQNIDYFWDFTFLYKAGVKIGVIESGEFAPNFFAGTTLGVFAKNTLACDDTTLDSLYKGQERESQLADGHYQIVHDNFPAGIIKVKNSMMRCNIENRFMRK